MTLNYKQESDRVSVPAFTIYVATARTGRADDAMVSCSEITSLTRFLGVILILTALSAPVRALGAVLPPGQSVTLAWTPSTEPNTAGCNLYYGVASGNYTNMVNPGTATSVTIFGLVEGTTYFFAATAYNILGLESDFSNEASYTVPVTLPGIPGTLQVRITPTRQIILTVTGQVGTNYNIQASPDFTNWIVIGTVMVAAGGSVDFTDTNAASFPKRFYRTQ
jgi:hypothetical protein